MDIQRDCPKRVDVCGEIVDISVGHVRRVSVYNKLVLLVVTAEITARKRR